MTMKKHLILLLFTMIGTASFIPAQVQAQSKREREEQVKAQIKQRVDSRQVLIRITEAAGARNTSGILEGSVEIMDTLLVSNLPYYGRLHTPASDPSQAGLNFESSTYDYLHSVLDDGSAKILFNVKRGLETFAYYIVITSKGRATVSVYSDKRTPASYSGEINLQ